MIAVEQALGFLSDISPNNVEEINVAQSVGHTLAQDAVTKIDHPPFNQSAMDGYGIGSIELVDFEVVDEVPAGKAAGSISLSENEAVRIFTGAMVPPGVVAVAQQEIVTVNGLQIHLNQSVKKWKNIRDKGEQTSKGEVVLSKGTKISPAAVGLLSGLGLTTVHVYRKPNVVIIATGDELVTPGEKLPQGKIYESNTFAFQSACSQLGFGCDIQQVSDNLENTFEILEESLNKYDVVAFSGGISVGKYDYVGEACKRANVEQVFYKVSQKPGKPLYYGRNLSTHVFGLPGNPAAMLTCFYIYVLKVLQGLCGGAILGLPHVDANLKRDYYRKGDRAHFLKVQVKNDEIEILEGQSSAMMHTFAIANGLAYFPNTKDNFSKGEQVKVYLLPT